MKEFIKIKTKRLVLRPLKVEDISKVYIDNLNDEDVNHFISTHKYYNSLKTISEHITKYDGTFLGIFLKAVHIGNLTISNGIVGIRSG